MNLSVWTLQLLVVLLAFQLALAQEEDSDALNYVTCGSLIKLKHVSTEARLHSHNVNYATGSRQQSVTGLKSAADPGSFWTIREPFGENQCIQGTPIKANDKIRLFHAASGKFLHSHLHSSPITRYQEVSCFGGESQSNSGDDWIVVLKDPYWMQESKIRLEHADTHSFLHCTDNAYPQPIEGQLEVAARPRRSADNLWVAGEGIFFPRQDKLRAGK
mmetsp:Transcript_41327/g.104208  ORF Transcript_41327/g.104208 Transcript_41327/m.104208 type:complete len:217 (-) Transcript_41327:76-726(-)|eukprot:CAMPEP_0177637994 /NCGR_PEP_ID=MMETSP0447-20121125/5258_1 /TAXON_ID=0 /ORGANISM="Stygamoeba regulata, Strain BSH-02190019" /LENGTH=216 /DNA_ID=CAMNT_0019139939 /DNA_START=127 /DNA_END=777 /DNA_ORIENTATION=-